METLKRYGFFFLILAVISELTVPFVLGHYVPGYSQLESLISSLGETGMPTKTAFRIWEIINGCLFILAAPAFYQRFAATNRGLASGVSLFLIIFALGDCIITGFASQASTPEEIGPVSLLHNYASGAGVLALLLGTFFLIWLYQIEENQLVVIGLLFVFFLSSAFLVLYASPNIPLLNEYQITNRGLWQRLNLFFSYLPYGLVSVTNLSSHKRTCH